MDKNSSLTDWIQIIFTIIAGIYALYLLRSNIGQRRKGYLFDIYKSFYGDDEITQVLYYVDKETNENKIRHLGELEKQADKTLHYLDLIGQMLKDGDIKKGDLSKFKYEIKRILKNEEVAKYIIWLRKLGVPLTNLERLGNL